MPRLSSRVLADAYTSDFAWNVLKELTSIGNRMGGQKGERRGASVVAEALEEAGLRNVEMESFDVPGWWRDSTSLVVTDRHEREFTQATAIIALPGTPAGEASGELVDLGYGLLADYNAAGDIDGKIVVVKAGAPVDHDRWVHRNEKYAMAVERGAAAFLFQNDAPGCLPLTGCIGYEDSVKHERILGAGVSYELGHRLRMHAAEGDGGATLSIKCRNEASTSQNVQGFVGPDTEQEIVVGAHYDSHDISEGAGDDGAGTAIVAEIGRLLAREESKLETKVRIVGFGAEEIGTLGSYHLVNITDHGRIKAAVNNDGIGDDRTLKLNYSSFEEFVEPFERAADELNVPLAIETNIHPFGDKWPFVQEGIAACGVSSGGDGRFAHAHTHADTLDKIDRRDLRALAVIEASAILKLAEESFTVPHKSKVEIADAMHPDYEAGLRAEGRWPFDDEEDA